MIATIADTESISGVVVLRGMTMVAIQMPDDWDAASLTFQGSDDAAGPFTDIYSTSGTEFAVTAAASRWIPLDPTDFYSVRYLKIRSGTAAIPVAQSPARELRVITAKV